MILNLAVHPDFGRRGLQILWLKNILEELKENACRFLYLEVRASKHMPQENFMKAWIQRCPGTRKGYYTEPKEEVDYDAKALGFLCLSLFR